MFSESNQIKVLVADDNREFCGILKSYFTNDPDFQLIDVCTNGMEVINVLQKEEVEVLILDLIMPYMDGIGVLEKINSMNLENDPGYYINRFWTGKYYSESRSIGSRLLYSKTF